MFLLAIDSISQQNVGPNLDMSSSVNSGAMKVTQAENGREFIQQNASQLGFNNYRGSAMESAVLTELFV